MGILYCNNFQLMVPNSVITKKNYSPPPTLLHHHPHVVRTTTRTPLKMSVTQSAQNPVVDELKNPVVNEQQKVIITNNHGEKLVGFLHETGSRQIVILCHGFQSSKENNIMTSLAVALQNEGISAFRFDFAGNGESEGSFEYGNYRREADDLHAVIQHFRSVNRVISAIIGHSKGGGVVLLYAAKYQDVPAVVNLSGRYDLKNGIEGRLGKEYLQKIKEIGFIDVKNKTGTVEYRVTAESLMDRLNINMHDECLKISKECRVLTIHGSDDEVIPVGDASEFAKLIPNHELQVVEGANHCYTEHLPELVPIVVNFIKTVI